jgi:hypothetical protein
MGRGRRWPWVWLCAPLWLSLAGCADYSEVENVMVVTGIAIDSAEQGQLSVTLDIVNPEQRPSQEEQGAATCWVTPEPAGEVGVGPNRT